MRIYSEDSMETLRARKLLKEWTGERFLTDAQYEQLEQETVSELRTTNLFLRVVLFFFTILCVAAACGLCFLIFLRGGSAQSAAVLLLIFAAGCYGAAEYAVSEFSLYRHGIEEALAVCSVGFLCAGLFASLGPSGGMTHSTVLLVASVGAAFSLWIWHRFGLWYAFLAAMIFAVYLPDDLTSSQPAQHVLIAVIYVLGLAGITALRSRHRFDYLYQTYSLAEAFLWAGLYLTMNLKVSELDLLDLWIARPSRFTPGAPGLFYWITWVLIWCLPPVILARGIRLKDRFVIIAGAIAAMLTLATNKPYLGWQRHTWDPMILGIVLTCAAIYLRRWLMQGPGGVRYGFTAAPLSKKDRDIMNTGSAAFGLWSPHPVTRGPEPSGPDLSGGESGGGGASREF
jgi:hypothetical protein